VSPRTPTPDELKELKEAEEIGRIDGAGGFDTRHIWPPDLRAAYVKGWQRGLADRPAEWLPVKLLQKWFADAKVLPPKDIERAKAWNDKFAELPRNIWRAWNKHFNELLFRKYGRPALFFETTLPFKDVDPIDVHRHMRNEALEAGGNFLAILEAIARFTRADIFCGTVSIDEVRDMLIRFGIDPFARRTPPPKLRRGGGRPRKDWRIVAPDVAAAIREAIRDADYPRGRGSLSTMSSRHPVAVIGARVISRLLKVRRQTDDDADDKGDDVISSNAFAKALRR
jgi:hypothetical protein